MSSIPPEERAARVAAAINGLGHIAMGHPLDGARGSKGDAEVRKELHENAMTILDLVAHEAKRKAPAVPRPAECEAALSRFRDMAQSIDFNDAASMASFKALARKALEAFGIPLAE